MAIGNRINCDVCGVEKKETNHWFLVRTWLTTDGPEMKIKHFKLSKARRPGAKVICGEGCLQKVVSQTFVKVTKAPENAIAQSPAS